MPVVTNRNAEDRISGCTSKDLHIKFNLDTTHVHYASVLSTDF